MVSSLKMCVGVFACMYIMLYLFVFPHKLMSSKNSLHPRNRLHYTYAQVKRLKVDFFSELKTRCGNLSQTSSPDFLVDFSGVIL